MYIYNYKSLMKSLFANIADLSRKKSDSFESLFEYCRLRYRKHCLKTFVGMICP